MLRKCGRFVVFRDWGWGRWRREWATISGSLIVGLSVVRFEFTVVISRFYTSSLIIFFSVLFSFLFLLN